MISITLRAWLWLALSALLALRASAQEPIPPVTLQELQGRFTDLIEQPKYAGALWGVKVVSLDTGKTLFEHNPQKLFSPASNSKLYTVALALERLGPDYRIKTSLYSKSRPDGRGTLQGNLIVYGRGDPTINARLNGGDILKALEPLATVLTNAGVKRIAGDLIGDASYFRGPEYGSGWVWEDLEYYYGAEVNALTINDNLLSISVIPGDALSQNAKLLPPTPVSYLVFSNRTQTVQSGLRRVLHFYRPLGGNLVYVQGQVPIGTNTFSEEIPVHNPAGLFIELFKQVLLRHGIRVEGKLRTLNWLERGSVPLDCDAMVELGAVESLPMSDLAREIFKPSQNLYTDLILAHVGEKNRASDDHPEETSEDLGIRELNKFLLEAGINHGEVIFEEGSGLSRDNLTTPNATVTLLQHASRRPWAGVYSDALPVAGVDGTLRNRMKGTVAEGKLRAKTGTLRWANSLSGYVTSAAGEHLVFSLMVNRFQGTAGNSARADLDAMGVLLAGFTGRSQE